MTSITLQGITKRFGQTEVLRGIDLEIGSGEFFFLLGPSGCGKSTLLRMIAGLESPSSGAIRVGDRDITNLPPHKRGIGMVFQQYALWPHMSVFDNIAFGLRASNSPSDTITHRVEEVLTQVRLDGFGHRFPSELSGGQQQRVALARALAPRPTVVLLDEPLSNLDARLRENIRKELAEIHRTLGITMVYVTHDQEDALALGSRVAIMRSGVIEQCGTPEELYTRPRTTFVADFMGDANFIPCSLAKNGEVELFRLGVPPSHILAIRPESITVASIDGDNSHHASPERVSLSGRIQSITYRGAWHDVEVNIAPPEISPAQGAPCQVQRVIATTRGEALGGLGRLVENTPVVISWRKSEGIVLPK